MIVAVSERVSRQLRHILRSIVSPIKTLYANICAFDTFSYMGLFCITRSWPSHVLIYLY